jgi:hypothetical protein
LKDEKGYIRYEERMVQVEGMTWGVWSALAYVEMV